jgi:xanthine dehydrogenase accessory factor
VHNLLSDLMDRWQTGIDVALATVVATRRSAPLQPGTSLLVTPDRSVVGSVSGGCVEADVYAVAEQVLADGQPVLRTYGISDEDAFGVGLTCGGSIDVFVERISRAAFPELERVAHDVAEQRPTAVATIIAHPDPTRVGQHLVLGSGQEGDTLDEDHLGVAVRIEAQDLLAAGRCDVLHYGIDGKHTGEQVEIFVESLTPRPRLIVFGASEFATAVADLGTFLDYRVTVCDARPLFATRDRFPQADDVIVDWPHRYLDAEVQAGRIDSRTAICVLTHDPKFDVPLLRSALTMPVDCYVGAIGSRRAQKERVDSLMAEGVSTAALRRLSSPIGLDLGARTPRQTAVSILAEIIAVQSGGSGARLGSGSGPIHRESYDAGQGFRDDPDLCARSYRS